MKQVRCRVRLAELRQTSNIIYRRLPTNDTRSHVTGVRGCLGYRCQKEILNHVLKCPNKEARETRKAALAAFRVEGKKKRIPRTVIDRIHCILSHYTYGQEGGVATSDNSALDATTNQ